MRTLIAAAALVALAPSAMTQGLDSGLDLDDGGTGLGLDREGIGPAEYGDRGVGDASVPPLGDRLREDTPLVDEGSGGTLPGARPSPLSGPGAQLAPGSDDVLGGEAGEPLDAPDDPLTEERPELGAEPVVDDRAAASEGPLAVDVDDEISTLGETADPVEGDGGGSLGEPLTDEPLRLDDGEGVLDP